MHSEKLAAAGAAGDEMAAYEVLAAAAGPELAAQLTAAKIDELMGRAQRLRWAPVDEEWAAPVLDKLPPALASALKDAEARVAEKGGFMRMGARAAAGLIGTLKKEARALLFHSLSLRPPACPMLRRPSVAELEKYSLGERPGAQSESSGAQD